MRWAPSSGRGTAAGPSRGRPRRFRETGVDRVHPDRHKKTTNLQIEMPRTSSRAEGRQTSGSVEVVAYGAADKPREEADEPVCDPPAAWLQPPRRDCVVQSTAEPEVAEPELRQGALAVADIPGPAGQLGLIYPRGWHRPPQRASWSAHWLPSDRLPSPQGVHCSRGRLGFSRARWGRLRLPSHQTKRL